MSIEGWIRWAISPEGIRLNRAPKELGLITQHLCHMMAIGVDEFSKPQLFQVARYIAHNEDECLFLLHRFHEEANIRMKEGDKDWRYTQYCIRCVFGEDGWDTLYAAAELYTSRDPARAAGIQFKAALLAHAGNGYVEEFKVYPGLSEAAKVGKSFGMAPTDADDIRLAYLGFHYIWFCHIFEERFGAWLELESAQELMAKITRVMTDRIKS